MRDEESCSTLESRPRKSIPSPSSSSRSTRWLSSAAMSEENRPTTVAAAVLTNLETIEATQVQTPLFPPPPDEVQIKVMAVGICGSDLAYWKRGVAGGFKKIDFDKLNQGYCGRMGHECAGVVVATGGNVHSIQLGDRVALEPGIPCSTCSLCRRGRYNLCRKVRFIGSAVNETPGALIQVFNHPAEFCHKLPDHISMEEGAMIEPLCVALQAVHRARITIGQKVLITGAGPIGLLTALALRTAGASTVVLTDISRTKLDLAARLGFQSCDAAYGNAQSVFDKLQNISDGHFDACFECSGVKAGLDLCIQAAESGGVICVVANHKPEVSIGLQELSRREIDIVGVYRYCNLYPKAISLLASGSLDVKPLISDRKFGLHNANEAFAYFASGEPVKVIINPNPEICLRCAEV